QPSQDALGRVDFSWAYLFADAGDGVVGHADGETDASREILFEKEERRDAERVHVAEVVAAIGLDGAGAAQDAHPVDVALGTFQVGLDLAEDRVFHFEHAGGDVDAFEEFADLRKEPALIVGHRLVGQSLEEKRAGHYAAIEGIGGIFESGGRVV